MLLCAGQPLEDSFVDLRVGPKEEAGLMAPGRDQIELAGFVSSQWASHERW